MLEMKGGVQGSEGKRGSNGSWRGMRIIHQRPLLPVRSIPSSYAQDLATYVQDVGMGLEGARQVHSVGLSARNKFSWNFMLESFT